MNNHGAEEPDMFKPAGAAATPPASITAGTEWPAVWATYWSQLDEETVGLWDGEIVKVFGRDALNKPRVTEQEICTAIRALGASGKFRGYRPKVGDIIHEIREARNRKMREDATTGLPAPSHVRCLLCNDSGWVRVPFVEAKVSGVFKKTLPRVVTETISSSDDTKTMDILTLEPHQTFATACLACGKGSPFYTNKMGRRAEDEQFLRQYELWLERLPDQCINKPESLRKEKLRDVVWKERNTRAAAKTDVKDPAQVRAPVLVGAESDW